MRRHAPGVAVQNPTGSAAPIPHRAFPLVLPLLPTVNVVAQIGSHAFMGATAANGAAV